MQLEIMSVNIENMDGEWQPRKNDITATREIIGGKTGSKKRGLL
jgi:hypothetical protein